MKPHLSFAAWQVSVLMALFINEKGTCQESDSKSDSTWCLIIISTRTKEHVHVLARQSLRYRLPGSNRYVLATITDITERAVSFQGKDKKSVSVKPSELAVIKIPRSLSRKNMGMVFTVIGGLAMSVGLAAATSPVEEGFYTLGLVIGAAGLPILAGGIALKRPRKIDFEKTTWKLTLGQLRFVASSSSK